MIDLSTSAVRPVLVVTGNDSTVSAMVIILEQELDYHHDLATQIALRARQAGGAVVALRPASDAQALLQRLNEHASNRAHELTFRIAGAEDVTRYKLVLAPLVPTSEQLDWLREHAVEFASVAPDSSIGDLAPLKSIIGDARIVALGEDTHGAREFFQLKHKILRFLVTDMGFTHFAIEGYMPEAGRVNDYVLNRVGDAKEALAGLGFWTWNTQEVLDMIVWMHDLNASGRGPVTFWGFDCQAPFGAERVVRSFVQEMDPAFLYSLDQAYAGLPKDRTQQTRLWAATQEEKESLLQGVQQVLSHLESSRADYHRVSHSTQDVEWAVQNARIVSQSVELVNVENPIVCRDRNMADNVSWILGQAPKDAKIVLWAHNGHISKSGQCMGKHLLDCYGSDYFALAFAFHQGGYTALPATSGPSASQPAQFEAMPSHPGTVEWMLHQVGVPRAILDLRLAQPASANSDWLCHTVLSRHIGAVEAVGPSVFHPTNLQHAYDGLVFIDDITASKCFGRPKLT